MSDYQFTSITFTRVPSAKWPGLAGQAARRCQGSLDGWVGSRRLEALAVRLASEPGEDLGPFGRAHRRRQAIAAVALAEALVRVGAPGCLRRADALLAESRSALAGADIVLSARLANTADDLLRNGLIDTADQLRIEERSLAGEAAGAALSRMGFALGRAEGKRATALWAVRGHVVLAALVHDGATMAVDTAGCDRDREESVLAEFFVALAAEGVACEIARVVTHGDDPGGGLIALARRAPGPGGNLATCLVAQFERGIASADHG